MQRPPASSYALPLLPFLAACAPMQEDRSANRVEASSTPLLVRSVPADGAVVATPPTLVLRFREPVRLTEVTVSGPSGEMPMMVTSAGEQASYSIPLPELEPGSHEVRWRALAQGGVPHVGSLSFTVH